MFMACSTRRRAKRKELALETALERELEGLPTEGGEALPPAGHV